MVSDAGYWILLIESVCPEVFDGNFSTCSVTPLSTCCINSENVWIWIALRSQSDRTWRIKLLRKIETNFWTKDWLIRKAFDLSPIHHPMIITKFMGNQNFRQIIYGRFTRGGQMRWLKTLVCKGPRVNALENYRSCAQDLLMVDCRSIFWSSLVQNQQVTNCVTNLVQDEMIALRSTYAQYCLCSECIVTAKLYKDIF